MHHLIAIGYGGTTLSLDENCQGTVVVLRAHSDLFEGHAPHDLDAKPLSSNGVLQSFGRCAETRTGILISRVGLESGIINLYEWVKNGSSLMRRD